MSKRIAITLLAVLVLTVSACTRTASTPFPTLTVASNFPAMPAAATSMKVIEDAGTQTAIAQTGTPQGGQPAVSTPVPESLATVTPQPGATLAPTATTASAANTPVPGGATAVPTTPPSYTLHEGEFVYCLARRFNVNPDEILALNGLSSGQTLYAGLTLKIPTTNHPFPGPRALKAHPVQYTVVSGDTIYSVACKFGDVFPIDIANKNGLQSPYNLTVGSQITIP